MFSTKLAMMSIFMNLVVLSLLFVLAVVIVFIAGDSLPGDALFPLKTELEDLQVMFVDTADGQARLHLQIARRRLSELESLLSQGRHTDIILAGSEFAKNIQRASVAVTNLVDADSLQGAAFNSEILTLLRSYSSLMNQSVAKIPSTIQPVIEKVDVPSSSHTPTPRDDDNSTNEVVPTISPTMTPMVIVLPTSNVSSSPAILQSGLTMEGDNATCYGSVGAVIVQNLRVPPGASCTLDGTRVKGNIKVENSASLSAQRIIVIGNIQGEGAKFVEVLAGSTVSGNIQLKQGGSARIESTSVNGDIQFESNQGFLNSAENLVGGNLQVFQNMGGATISTNTIDGNLQCKENSPAPTGGNNQVQGNKEDQCADL